MDTWWANLNRCTCWHPTVNNVVTSLKDNVVPSTNLSLLQDFVDICDIYSYSPEAFTYIHEKLKLIRNDLSTMNPNDASELQTKMMSIEKHISSTHCHIQTKCTHTQPSDNDHAFVRTQGYVGTLGNIHQCVNDGRPWQPYTTAYNLVDVVFDHVLELPEPVTPVQRILYNQSQNKAKDTWLSMGITKAVDFSQIVHVNPPKNTQDIRVNGIVKFKRDRTCLRLINPYGEAFQFYTSDLKPANGPYQDSFRYLSLTDLFEYKKITSTSHTNTKRSDSSILFTWLQNYYVDLAKKHQNSKTWFTDLKLWRREINNIVFEPDFTDRTRYKMLMKNKSHPHMIQQNKNKTIQLKYIPQNRANNKETPQKRISNHATNNMDTIQYTMKKTQAKTQVKTQVKTQLKTQLKTQAQIGKILDKCQTGQPKLMAI